MKGLGHFFKVNDNVYKYRIPIFRMILIAVTIYLSVFAGTLISIRLQSAFITLMMTVCVVVVIALSVYALIICFSELIAIGEVLDDYKIRSKPVSSATLFSFDYIRSLLLKSSYADIYMAYNEHIIHFGITSDVNVVTGRRKNIRYFIESKNFNTLEEMLSCPFAGNLSISDMTDLHIITIDGEDPMNTYDTEPPA